MFSRLLYYILCFTSNILIKLYRSIFKSKWVCWQAQIFNKCYRLLVLFSGSIQFLYVYNNLTNTFWNDTFMFLTTVCVRYRN